VALPAAGTKPPDRETVDPNCRPTWPFLLVTGREKTGKTWWSVEGSASDLIDRAYLIEVGDGQGHEYGAIPGVKYKMVPHDGSYRDLYNAVWWSVTQPAAEGKVNLPILDSGTVLWDLIGSELQEVANRRFERRVQQAKRDGKKPPEMGPDGVDITMDLWNIGKKRWYGIIDLLRYYNGPAIIIARMEEVTVVKNGKPTTNKEWKVKAEKNLSFDVDGIIDFKQHQRPVLTGLRSVRFPVPEGGEVDLREHGADTFDAFMRKLGLAEIEEAAPRSHVAVNPTAGADEIECEEDTGERAPEANPKQMAAQRIADDAVAAPTLDDLRHQWQIANDQRLLGYPVTVNGQNGPLSVLFDHLGKGFENAAAAAQQEPPSEAPPAEQPRPQQSEQPRTDARPPGQPPPPEPRVLNPRERQIKRMIDEARVQAQWLGDDPAAHVASLVEGDPFAAPVTVLRDAVVAFREVVIGALREQGRASLADAYQAQGAKCPLDLNQLAATVENEVPQDQPAGVAT